MWHARCNDNSQTVATSALIKIKTNKINHETTRTHLRYGLVQLQLD